MKTVAEITDGHVTNIARIKDDAPVPDGWVECTGAACIGDLYDGQTFTAPAAPAVPVTPLEEARTEALAEVHASHASYLRQATDNATAEERDTWPAKSAAATAYLANTATTAQTTFIEAEATRGGVTPAEMAQTITAKADAFLDHIGQAAALCDPACASVQAAANHDELNVALAMFHADMQTALTALGGGQS